MSDSLISRPAQPRPCPRCRARLLVAIDLGLTIRAGAALLDLAAEITARLAGLPTFDVSSVSGKPYLWYRDISRIRLPRKYPVVGGHKCPDGKEVFVQWEIPAARTEPARPPVQFNPTEKVPF
jgi:hypothetical protein